MSENSNLPDRVAALETALARSRGGPVRFTWRISVALVLALLAANLWLLHQWRESQRQAGLEHHFWVAGHAIYPARDRAAAFLALVATGNQEWRGAHLDKLNLDGANLAGLDLQEINLEGGTLVKVSFAGAKLNKSKLPLTDFTDADFSGADLSGAGLFKARIKNTQFRKTRLRGANLEQVEAAGANFIAADLSDAWLLMADLSGANLIGANLTGANLEAAVLRRANLSLVRLDGVRLKDADFSDCNWWRARGLTTEQIAGLKNKFSPSEKAPATLRTDYEKWITASQRSQ